MDDVFKDENEYDYALKEFFKVQILNDVSTQSYSDEKVYVAVLKTRLLAVSREQSRIRLYVWIVCGLIYSSPLLLFLLFPNRESTIIVIAGLVFSFTYVHVYKLNKMSESHNIFASKIQAYKELLRDYSIDWSGLRNPMKEW